MSWSDVRTAVAKSLNGQKILAYEEMPNSLSELDVAVVLPGDPLIQPFAQGELDMVFVRIEVRSTRGDQKSGQKALDTLIRSVRVAVDADISFGGAVDSTRFIQVHSYGSISDQPGSFGATLDYYVLTEAA